MKNAGRINDWSFSWKFLYYTLIFFWPASAWKYPPIASMMAEHGAERWGGFARCFYLGLAVVWIPIVTAFCLLLLLAVL